LYLNEGAQLSLVPRGTDRSGHWPGQTRAIFVTFEMEDPRGNFAEVCIACEFVTSLISNRSLRILQKLECHFLAKNESKIF
jgi:hypothetical protein